MTGIITRRATEVWSVPIPGNITCLDCGRKFKALGGHLSKGHNMTSSQYRHRHALPPGYRLQIKEPPAPPSAEHRIVEHIKDFHFGTPGGVTCSFEFPLPEFSLATPSSSYGKDDAWISDVREFCDGADMPVWISLKGFQASIITETGKGMKFRLLVFQFRKNTDMAMCRLRFGELW
jgi:hypothetical protein